MAIWPWPLGSGKFDTPCARMHRENFSAGSTLEAVVLGVPDEPHAASVNTDEMAISAIRIYLPRGAVFAPGPPNLQAVAACLKAGEFMSIELGIARKYPPRPMTAL